MPLSLLRSSLSTQAKPHTPGKTTASESAANLMHHRRSVTAFTQKKEHQQQQHSQHRQKPQKHVPHYLQSTVASKHQRHASDPPPSSNRQHYPVGPVTGLAARDQASMLSSQRENEQRLKLEQQHDAARRARADFFQHAQKTKRAAADAQVACLSKGKHATEADHIAARDAQSLAERAAHELERLHACEQRVEREVARHKEDAHHRVMAARDKRHRAVRAKRELQQRAEDDAREKEAQDARARERREAQRRAAKDAATLREEKMRMAARAVQQQLDEDAAAARAKREKVRSMSRGLKGSLQAAQAFKGALRHDAEQRADHEIEVLHLHEHEIQRQMLSQKSDSHRRLMEKKRKMQQRRLERKKTKKRDMSGTVLGERKNGGGGGGDGAILRMGDAPFVSGAENAENVPAR